MRSTKLKLMVGALLVTMVGATFVGCGTDDSTASNGGLTISISGSTSVAPLMEKIQEEYFRNFRNRNVFKRIKE